MATDARRKEVYLASYAGGRRVSGPEVVKPVVAKTDGHVGGRGGVLYPEAFPNAAGRSTRRPRCCATSCSTRASRSSSQPALPASSRRRRAGEAEARQLTRGRANGPTYIRAVYADHDHEGHRKGARQDEVTGCHAGTEEERRRHCVQRTERIGARGAANSPHRTAATTGRATASATRTTVGPST